MLRLVRAEGARALAATRRPEAAAAADVAAADVADAVRFDWHDPSGHAAALRDVDRLYLVAPLGVAEPLPVVEPFLRTAVSRGVRRVVLLSSSAVPEAGTGLGALHALVKRTVPEWAGAAALVVPAELHR